MQIRVIPAHEQKVRTVSGSCIYAYEVTTSQSGLLLSGGQQTMTDIQRSAHSSKEPLTLHRVHQSRDTRAAPTFMIKDNQRLSELGSLLADSVVTFE